MTVLLRPSPFEERNSQIKNHVLTKGAGSRLYLATLY